MRLVAAVLAVAVLIVTQTRPAHAQISAGAAAGFDSTTVEFDVAELVGGGWFVSARGLGGASSNQLLVVIDGRPVSSPSSDIQWEGEPIPLEEIDRIEVVRGPRAVLWERVWANYAKSDGDLLMAHIHRPARHGRFCRHALILFTLAGCVTAAVRPAVAQNATTGEVKAAFLVNFARFTEFPEDAFSSPTAPFVIGIADDDTMRRSLDLVAGGKFVGKRALDIRNVKEAKDLEDLHMLFIGGESGVVERLKHLAARPVLTVGDANRFCDLGGMIMLALENNRVQFEIRIDAIEQAQLKVSSRVLSLAKAIHGKN